MEQLNVHQYAIGVYLPPRMMRLLRFCAQTNLRESTLDLRSAGQTVTMFQVGWRASYAANTTLIRSSFFIQSGMLLFINKAAGMMEALKCSIEK